MDSENGGCIGVVLCLVVAVIGLTLDGLNAIFHYREERS